jgi:hypothetical protein
MSIVNTDLRFWTADAKQTTTISSMKIPLNLLRLAAETLATVAAATTSHSHGVSAALKGVGHNEPRRELEIAPRSNEIETSTSRLFGGVSIRYL